jgi:peroxiredoxin
MSRVFAFGALGLAMSLVLAGCGDSELPDKNSGSTSDSSMSTGNSPLVGQSAPNFTLVSNNGESVTLLDVTKESPVVMVFYRGHWCPFCQTQLADYKKAENSFREAGAKVFLISIEGASDLSIMQNRHKMTGDVFMFLSDSEKAAGNDYAGFTEDGSVHNPAVYVIDSSGTVRYGFSDSDYTTRAAFSDVLAMVKSL